MTKAERQEELDCIKMVAQEALETACKTQPLYMLGHGFAWAKATVDGKAHRFMVGYVDGRAGHLEIAEQVRQSCKEITSAWINLD